jgi:hypothetical protein
MEGLFFRAMKDLDQLFFRAIKWKEGLFFRAMKDLDQLFFRAIKWNGRTLLQSYEGSGPTLLQSYQMEWKDSSSELRRIWTNSSSELSNGRKKPKFPMLAQLVVAELSGAELFLDWRHCRSPLLFTCVG